MASAVAAGLKLPVAAAPFPSQATVRINAGTFTSLCGTADTLDKFAKFARIILVTGAFYADRHGKSDVAVELRKADKVLGTIRVGLKALDPVTDLAGFIDACREGNGWDATLSALALTSDTLGTFNDIRGLAGVRFDRTTEGIIGQVGDYLTIAGLTPLVVTEAVRAAQLASEARVLQIEAETASKDGRIFEAQALSCKAEANEINSINKIMNVMDKTMVVALVVFSIIAAALSLATVIIVPVVAALSILSATFAIIKLCRKQFIQVPQMDINIAKSLDELVESKAVLATNVNAKTAFDAARQHYLVARLEAATAGTLAA